MLDLADLLDEETAEHERLLGQLEEVGYTPVEFNWEDADREKFHLVVIRESQKWDRRLLRAMALQTLRPLVGKVPGAEIMLAGCEDEDFVCFDMGARGHEWRKEHCDETVALRESGGRQYGWKFRIGPTWFIIAATSARSKLLEEDYQNPFTRDLRKHVDGTPTDHVWAGPFTRLVRRASLGAELQECFEGANNNRGLTVHIKEYPSGIPFRKTAAGMTNMVWGLLGTIAEQEVRMSTLRMLLGRIVGSDDNRWDRDQDLLPPYLTLDDRKRIVAANDPRGLAEARAWVRVAALAHDEDLAPEEVVAILSDDPDVQATITTGPNAGRPLKEHTNPSQALLTRLRWLPAMRRGRYAVLQGLPTDGCTPDDVLGKRVFNHTIKVDGRTITKQKVMLDWDIPSLDGIDDETWDKAQAYFDAVKQNTNTGPTERSHNVLPFGSVFRGTAHEEGHHRLLVPAQGGYELRETAIGAPIRSDDSGVIAKAGAEAMANAVVDTILHAAQDNTLPLDIDDLNRSDVAMRRSPAAIETPATIAARQERDRLLGEVSKHQTWLDDTSFPDVARADVETALATLERELADAEEQLRQATDQAASVADATAPDDEVKNLADLFALVQATAGGTVPSPIRTRLADELCDPQADAEVHDPWITLRFGLVVHAEDGDRVAGPFVTTVPNEARGYRVVGTDDKGADMIKRDRVVRVFEPEMLRRLCVDRMTLEEIAARRGVQVRNLRRSLHKMLTGASCYARIVSDAAASAWLDAPAELRLALYAMALDRGLLPWEGGGEPELPVRPVPVPPALDGLDRAETAVYLEHLFGAVFDDEWTAMAYSSGGELDLRSGLVYVQAVKDPTMSGFAEAFGWSHTTGAAGRASFSKHAGVLVVWDDPTSEDPSLSVRVCPHCGYEGGLHVLRAIDVPEGVICPQCHRMPGAPDLPFPDVHLQLWEGPYGNTTSKNREVKHEIAGTRTGEMPPVPTKWRRQKMTHADGTAARRAVVTGRCDFDPAADDGPSRRCPKDRAPGRARYCARHADRNKRAADARRHRTATAECKTEGCTNRRKPPGRGRPPAYCSDCRPEVGAA